MQTVPVEKTTFWGLDCVDQFVEWLVANNFIESDINYQSDLAGSASEATKRKKIENYIFAHNGFRFDYRFLYEKIYARVGDMVLIGDVQQTKAFVGQGLNFYDTALFFPQALGSLAESFFPRDPTRRKLDGDVAVHMTIEQFTQELPAQVDTIAQIKTYCEQDAFLVQQISEAFFGEVFTTKFGHGFTSKIVYHSAPSLAWDIWQNCFLKRPIFINPATQTAEKLSYRGGLAMVTKLFVEKGAVYDITSSYPASMSAPMPIDYVHPNMPPEIFAEDILLE